MKVIGLIALKNPVAFDRYRSQVGETISKHGGTVVFRGARTDWFWNDLACAEFDACVEIDFPTREHAQTWANSPDYAALLAVRNEAMTLTLFGLQ